MYGQAASHVRTMDASELSSQITLERERIAKQEQQRQSDLMREEKKKAIAKENLDNLEKKKINDQVKYQNSPLLLDQKKKVGSPVEAFHFRYENPKNDFMDQKLKKLEDNFLGDFHVVENESAPVIINLNGASSDITHRKLREVKLADSKDHNIKEMK